MSFGIGVFEPNAVPNSRKAFLVWWEKQCALDCVTYDPRKIAPAIGGWYTDMIELFPPLDASISSLEIKSSNWGEYQLHKAMINVSFAWSQKQNAQEATQTFAEKHKVGVYFSSSQAGEIFVPGIDGLFHEMH